MLINILADSLNYGYNGRPWRVLESLNGRKITNMDQLCETYIANSKEFHRFSFSQEGDKIVLDAQKCRQISSTPSPDPNPDPDPNPNPNPNPNPTLTLTLPLTLPLPLTLALALPLTRCREISSTLMRTHAISSIASKNLAHHFAGREAEAEAKAA